MERGKPANDPLNLLVVLHVQVVGDEVKQTPRQSRIEAEITRMPQKDSSS